MMDNNMYYGFLDVLTGIGFYLIWKTLFKMIYDFSKAAPEFLGFVIRVLLGLGLLGVMVFTLRTTGHVIREELFK